jgi:hypothetical protein
MSFTKISCTLFVYTLSLRILYFSYRRFLFYLKGELHEIFDPRFFHQSTPPRVLIHGLRPLRIFAGKIDNIKISAGSLTPLKSVLKNHYHDLFQTSQT